jgi:hypothetical protein
VRWSDDNHITAAGGEWLRPRILPEVAKLELPDQEHQPAAR